MSDKTVQDVAVALKYLKENGEAPTIVAKGYGEVARRIVELATENDIVIESNPHLAEALSGVDLEESIPLELYEAVAEVIGFVLRVQTKMR